VSQLATVRRHRVDNTYLVTALTAGDDARCWSEIAIFTYPTCIQRPHLGSSRQNIVMTYGREKLEWCGYPIVKKNWRDVYSFWQNPRTWRSDRRTDGHRMTMYGPYLHSIARQQPHNNGSLYNNTVIGRW